MENQNLNDPSKDKFAQPNHDLLNNRREQYREETSSELVNREDSFTDQRNDEEIRNVYGWIAIALSVISFFWIPLLFAGAGIILGFVARNREARILGNTAIVIGILSIITRLFILPLI